MYSLVTCGQALGLNTASYEEQRPLKVHDEGEDYPSDCAAQELLHFLDCPWLSRTQHIWFSVTVTKSLGFRSEAHPAWELTAEEIAAC